MEEDGIIVKLEEHSPWVSSMLVIDRRKGKDKSNPPSKDSVRICIDPRDLNNSLKRPHYPMVTVEQVANRLSGATRLISRLLMPTVDIGSFELMRRAQDSLHLIFSME